MLQHWASEGEFYTGTFFVLHNSIELLYFYVVHFILNSHIGQIVRYNEEAFETFTA